MSFTRDGVEIDYSEFVVGIDTTTSEIIRMKDGKPAYSFHTTLLHDHPNSDYHRLQLLVFGPKDPIYSKLFEDRTKLKLLTIILSHKNNDASKLPDEMH